MLHAKGKMDKNRLQQILECGDFEQLIEITYGKRGTPSREAYEEECEEWLKKKRFFLFQVLYIPNFCCTFAAAKVKPR